MLDVVMMIGLAPGAFSSCMSKNESSSGEAANEGPLGEDVFDLRNADVDFEAFKAISARAAARSGWCINVVRRDRREGKCGLESTRWNSCFSLTLDAPLSVAESSQSEESSSSSIALSETSSSSSESSNTSSSSCDLLVMVLDSTSSLKDVCFISSDDRFKPDVRLLLCDCWADILSSNELSSSPEEPPSMNPMLFFFFASSVLGWTLDLVGTGVGAR